MMMRPAGLGLLATCALLGATVAAFAQSGVAAPGLVQSAPLARPAEPQPVQPSPAPGLPVTPQPVQPAPTPQVPLEPTPVQPPPTLPVPGAPAAPSPQQRTSAPDSNATMAGKPGNASDVDEVQLVAKPVLTLSGQSSWDQGFKALGSGIKALRDEAAKAGLAVAGRPLALFVETDDNGFKFEAMLPVAVVSGAPPAAYGNGIKAGTSPMGKSFRFVHVSPYDDIDSTYETITAYLEAKSIAVKDLFIEEYVSELVDPTDPNLEINVYVQPR